MSKAQTALAISFGAFIGIILILVFGLLSYFAGPHVQALMFPILRAQHVAGSVERDENSLCWSTHLEKLREGEPAYFLYWLVRPVIVIDSSGQRVVVTNEIPAAPYRLVNGERKYLSKSGFNTSHVAGDVWQTRYCLDIPSSIAVSDYFTVVGEGYYDVSHHLWRVPVTLPTFFVPGGLINDSNPDTSNRTNTVPNVNRSELLPQERDH